MSAAGLEACRAATYNLLGSVGLSPPTSAAARVHLEVRVALRRRRDEQRASPRGEPLFGAAVGAELPRCANQLRQLLVASRPPRSGCRRSVPRGGVEAQYQRPSAVSRLRSHARQNGSVVDAMIPNPCRRPGGSVGGRRALRRPASIAPSAPRAARASPCATRRAASTSASRRRRPCTR